jgi:hypothetical protein
MRSLLLTLLLFAPGIASSQAESLAISLNQGRSLHVAPGGSSEFDIAITRPVGIPLSRRILVDLRSAGRTRRTVAAPIPYRTAHRRAMRLHSIARRFRSDTESGRHLGRPLDPAGGDLALSRHPDGTSRCLAWHIPRRPGLDSVRQRRDRVRHARDNSRPRRIRAAGADAADDPGRDAASERIASRLSGCARPRR